MEIYMNPIEAAVAPLKQDAIENAHQRVGQMIQRTITALEENDWDARIVAPYPNSRTDGRIEFQVKQREYQFVRDITAADKVRQPYRGRSNDPEYRIYSEDRVNAMIKQWEDMAAAQYESFVAKLVHKIGECVSATLDGNHVWGYSILHIVKADGTKEKWKTQMIFKLSKLGKPHNQWPTRKVK